MSFFYVSSFVVYFKLVEPLAHLLCVRATLFRSCIDISCYNCYICLVIKSAFWELVDKFLVSYVIVSCNAKMIKKKLHHDVTDLSGV